MTVFNIDLVDEGTWYNYRDSVVSENGSVVFLEHVPGSGRAKIKNPDPEWFDALYAETRRTSVSHLPNPARNNILESIEKSVPKNDVAKKQEKERLYDEWIQDYEGFKNSKGVEIPVTLENKVALMDQVPAFNRFVGECLRLERSNKGLAKKAGAENF